MNQDKTITVVLNGDTRPAPAGAGLIEFVESLGLPIQGALIEHNGTALLRDEWAHARLADGDRLEILRVVAGG